MSILTLGVLFPVALLFLALAMERVERPLERDSMNEQLETFLTTARPEEVETFVSNGYGPAIEMYWRNRNRQVQSHPPSGGRPA